jgi:uncharacterized protein YkwD
MSVRSKFIAALCFVIVFLALSAFYLNAEASYPEAFAMEFNAYRFRHGLPRLPVDENLNNLAVSYAELMVEYGFSHRILTELEFFALMQEHNAYGYSWVRELILKMRLPITAQYSLLRFINSPNHKPAILDPSAIGVGVGHTVAGGVAYIVVYIGVE